MFFFQKLPFCLCFCLQHLRFCSRTKRTLQGAFWKAFSGTTILLSTIRSKGKTHFRLPLPFRLSLQVWVLNFCLPQNFRLTIFTEFLSTTDFPSTTEFSSNHDLWSNPQLFIFSSSNTEFWSNHELRSTPELVSNTEFLSNTEISSFTEFSSTNFRFIKGFVSRFNLLR